MQYLKKSSQEVNKVYKTNDLSVFKQIIGNRPPNPQHIRRLVSSIKEYGILENPILVNENFEVIDGQHRLMAAKQANSFIYFIIIDGYSLTEVQVLNLNQKNWTNKDFMDGYASMGIESYIELKRFVSRNKAFSLANCISMCSDGKNSANYTIASKFDKRTGKTVNLSQVFEEGTWKGGDFNLAQEFADKISLIKPYYDGYNRGAFVNTMLTLIRKDNFDVMEFISKLKMQVTKMQDCTNVSQYKLLIEDIYNYRRREKVNLRY